jgi:hypothetical protein
MRILAATTMRATSLFAALALGATGAGHARAATAGAEVCRLPLDAPFAAEERTASDSPATMVVVTSSGSAIAPLAPGDVVRQANGVRVHRCADLERASAEARRSGLTLLVAVEHQGKLLALAVPEAGSAESALTVAPIVAPRPERASAESAAEAAPPTPRPTVAPRAPALASLPAATQAPPAVRSAAQEAAEILNGLATAARPGVSIPVYDSKLREAEERLAPVKASLTTTSPASAALRTSIDGIVAYYRTASDIRRYQQYYVHNSGTERPGRSPVLPFVSTSPVPRWVGEYPFLEGAVLETPREAGIFGSEKSGLWDPERAVDLLWARASADTQKLADWAVAAG